MRASVAALHNFQILITYTDGAPKGIRAINSKRTSRGRNPSDTGRGCCNAPFTNAKATGSKALTEDPSSHPVQRATISSRPVVEGMDAPVDQQAQTERLIRERDEALEQQAATSEVLSIIARSAGELEPVFDAMLTNAARICKAEFATLYLYDGKAFRTVAATRNAPPAYVAARKREPHLRPPPDTPLGRVASTKQIAHIAISAKLQSYVERHPFTIAGVELGGYRTALGVPMLKDNELIGSFTVLRQQVRPFTDKQIELVQTFAAQAVIAIENARLLNELRQSLEQQTATSEVLRIISSSPGELEPVFRAVLENATRICEATFGVLNLHDNGALRMVAMHDVPPLCRISPRPARRIPTDAGQLARSHADKAGVPFRR